MTEPTFSLLYETKNGASVCKYLLASEVGPALSRLRCHAVLKNTAGAVVGGVEWIDGADDPNINWSWWYNTCEVSP